MRKKKVNKQISKKPKETILVFAAHNDDGIIGAGGTLAKYAKQGKIVKTVVFSFGEKSHPHLKPKIIKMLRYKEAIKSDKILGGAGIAFLDLKEMKFKQEVRDKKVKNLIKEIIKNEMPIKIFTHSINDTMPDHRAVHHIVMNTLDEINFQGDVYSFGVWNILNLIHRNKPKMIVDISDTFKKKIKAFKAHKSQKGAQILLMWKIYIQDFTNGFNSNCKFAEVFVKLR